MDPEVRKELDELYGSIAYQEGRFSALFQITIQISRILAEMQKQQPRPIDVKAHIETSILSLLQNADFQNETRHLLGIQTVLETFRRCVDDPDLQ